MNRKHHTSLIVQASLMITMIVFITAIVGNVTQTVESRKEVQSLKNESVTLQEQQKINSSISSVPSIEVDTALEASVEPYDDFLGKEVLTYTFDLCSSQNVDFDLVMAVIEEESYFKADAISSTNDYGLMQINSVNHNRLSEALGVTDFLDPKQNIEAGVYMLNQYFDKGYSAEESLMCYALGEGGAAQKWKQCIYDTVATRKILEIWERNKIK